MQERYTWLVEVHLADSGSPGWLRFILLVRVHLAGRSLPGWPRFTWLAEVHLVGRGSPGWLRFTWKVAIKVVCVWTGRDTGIVATCGGDTVCLIDCGTGQVMKRFKQQKEVCK